MLLIKSFLITISILEVLPFKDYYWRDYHGYIPPDAVVAGATAESTTFIGRAPFERQGLVLGTITEGFRNLIISSSSEKFPKKIVHSVDKFVEILCSTLPFKWVPTNITGFWNLTGKVVGGYDAAKSESKIGNDPYIGRVKYGNKFIIGKIRDSYMVYAQEQNESRTGICDVLVYDDGNDMSYPTCSSSSQNAWYPDYYWRKYTGKLPQDAVIAAITGNVPTYIGRGAFANYGNLVGPIVNGSSDMIVTRVSEFSSSTVHTVDEFIEILCSPFPNRFSWVKTPLHNLFNRSELVQGGFENFNSSVDTTTIGLYIGRVFKDKEFKIGKIAGLGNHNETMFYAHKDEEEGTREYEVLIYSERMDPELYSTIYEIK